MVQKGIFTSVVELLLTKISRKTCEGSSARLTGFLVSLSRGRRTNYFQKLSVKIGNNQGRQPIRLYKQSDETARLDCVRLETKRRGIFVTTRGRY